MKFSKLKQIIVEEADRRKESSRFSGDWGDGGSQTLLDRLEKYQWMLLIKCDLKPSEFFSKLNDIEVGEPSEFSDIIDKYKIELSKSVKL
jgi:hypothetical protein